MVSEQKMQAALDRAGNTHTIQDVYEMCLKGDAQWWADGESVIVTEIVQFPRKRVLTCLLAAGRLMEIDAMVPKIETWAKTQGIDMVMISGRHGWSRFFSGRLYEEFSVNLRKTL